MFSVMSPILGRGTSRPGRPVNRHRYQYFNRLIITIAPTASLPCSITDDSMPSDLYSGLIYTEAKMSSIPSIQAVQPWIFSARVHEFPTTYPNTWPSQTEQLGTDQEPLQEGELTITPVFTSGTSVFGAEVSGLDWSKPIPEGIVHQVGDIAIFV